MLGVPLWPEHHSRALATLQVEGLRIGAISLRCVVHLHLLAAADHHGVLGGPLAVLGSSKSCVLVRRSNNSGFAYD